jgi:trigger factor
MSFKVDVEALDPVRRRLAVEVPAEEVAAEIEKTYAALGRAAKVPGFRPGRVPRPVLERLFGDRVRAEVFGKLIQHSYSEVLEERQIEALGQPEIVTEQAQPGEALRYSATVEVKPDVVVEHYTGIEVDRPMPGVDDADVDAFIERLRQSLAQLRPVTDRVDVRAGDVVGIDYEARMDGRVVSRGENRDIEIGANGFPPEFDQHIIGAAVGSELDFPVAYPVEHRTAELAGKSVQFHVRLRALSVKEVPVLDDEFAKDHGECATLAELRQRVRGRLEDEAARQADDAVRQGLLNELARAHDIAVPNALVQRRTDALIEDVRREWQQQRIRPRNESEAIPHLRQELEPRARQQVKVALILEAIARQENVQVTDADVEERVAALAAASGTAAERVRALYQDADARHQLGVRLLQSRALDLVVARARVRTVVKSANIAEGMENG